MNLKRALEIIDGGARIKHLRYITADVNKGTGGTVIELINCRLAKAGREATSGLNDNSGQSAVDGGHSGITRNPQHSLHFTRNLLLPNNQVRKVHPLLITHINQEEVI